MNIVEKPWGTEIWFANNEFYCGKNIVAHNGIWSSDGEYHLHPTKDETFYVIYGELLLDIDGEEIILDVGESMRIYPNTPHRFKSVGGTCEFIEVSTTHSDEDVIRGTLVQLRMMLEKDTLLDFEQCDCEFET